MKVINVEHPPKKYWLGRKGEKNFRPVPINAQAWLDQYPGTTVAVIYRRPDGTTFPVATSTLGEFEWLPKPDATAVAGEGKLEIHLMRGDEMLGISAMVTTTVAESLADYDDEEVPETPSWVDEVVQDVTEQADRAEEATSHYPKIVNGVWYVWSVQDEDFVSTGIEAQGEDGYSPTVTVTEIEGGHRVTITDATGAHTFDVMNGDIGVVGVDSVNGKTGVVVLDASDVGALPDDTPIPSKTSDLTNNSGFVTAQQAAASAPVHSVNGKTGVVVLDASDVGALPQSYTPPVSSVNGKTGAVTLGAADVHALPDSTVIPPTVTEQTVAGWGFTKNTGTYSKPSGGIPASDLASDVQTSLGKADTALQQHQSLAGYATETYVQQQIAAIPDELPAVTASDNGKFLRVVNGAWAAATVPAAESNSFGGGS